MSGLGIPGPSNSGLSPAHACPNVRSERMLMHETVLVCRCIRYEATADADAGPPVLFEPVRTSRMTTDSLPEHVQKPHLRPIQPLPFQKDGQTLIALRDPMMLSKETVVIPPQALKALQTFRGELTVEELAEQHSAPIEQLSKLAQGLDRVGLLWGPTFERLESECKQRVADAGAFPATVSTTLGNDEAECRSKIESYLDQTEDPELDATVVGLVAPHLDYERGWPNFAAAYYALRDMDPPDRVVILGTSHFGIGDGVVGTEFGFRSPMGLCPADETVTGFLAQHLGRPYLVDQLDHLPEHSVELHLPWVQYFFGNVPIVAALIPDPLQPMIAEDDERTTTEQFLEALRAALKDAGGRTFFIASSDLSHVGPQFGEPRPVDEQRRFDVERHDRDMLSKFLAGDPEEFISALKWNKNPTRWCSIGNMAALLELAGPQALELIDYRQACDERGHMLVSSAAIVLH